MKITATEVLSKSDFLRQEILNSLPYDVVHKANGVYEVMLLINGEEVEPMLLNSLYNKIAEVVDHEAKALILEKYEDAENKAKNLVRMIEDARANMVDQFDLNPKEYD